ncbi:MAG: putative toxin-antitoxin system toxin component, PIN family [Pseudomonadales bacterium]|nr:putative toxin-antitoxin system toxin component, PIN family [Candidatus Woesebacteria bacterium]MCB9802061.1 putative toxin-antitoxin system toxin component, PIN family [Pseudomonadales bacterium]
MKIVVDSNVWISALVFGGNPRKVIECVLQNNHMLVVSPTLLKEIRHNIRSKFPGFSQDFEAFFMTLQSYITLYADNDSLQSYSRDIDDDLVVELALVSNADMIITGDGDLLEIKKTYCYIASNKSIRFSYQVNTPLHSNSTTFSGNPS